jgi:hypothetical protein
MALVLRDKYGTEVDKTGYDIEGGNIFYKEIKVGIFEQAHDSNLGTYYLYIMNNGEEFHDHYANEKDILKACNL